MGFRVPFKGFGVLWEQGRDGGISSPTPRMFDETPSNQLLRFWVHLIYIQIFLHSNFLEESRSYLSRPFLFLFSLPFFLSPASARLSLEFRVSLQHFRMLGFAVPVLVRKDEKEWDLLPHISLQ